MDKIVKLFLSALVSAFLAGCGGGSGGSGEGGEGSGDGGSGSGDNSTLGYNTFAYFPSFSKGSAQIITEDYIKQYDYQSRNVAPYIDLLLENDFKNSHSQQCVYLISDFHKIISDKLAACVDVTYRMTGITDHDTLQLDLSSKGDSLSEGKFESVYSFFIGENELGNASNILKVVDYAGNLTEQIKTYTETLVEEKFVCSGSTNYCEKPEGNLTYHWSVDRTNEDVVQMVWIVQDKSK
jgi:hypothetical protein